MMNMFMTFTTDRNNIKPVDFVISKIMVIMLCLFIAIRTFVCCGFSQKACTNSIIDFVFGFYLFGIVFIITFMCLLAFCTLAVTFICLDTYLFTFFALGILLLVTFMAVFASRLQAVTAFRKLGQWKNSFAFITSFGYNWFRHGLIPYIKSCLEPPESYILSRGLSYYNTLGGLVNA